jgi:protein-tyrosine kinase
MGRVYNALLKSGRFEVRQSAPPASEVADDVGDQEPAEGPDLASSPIEEAASHTSRNLYEEATQQVRLGLVPAPQPLAPSLIERCKVLRPRVGDMDPRISVLTGTDELARQRYHTLAVRVLNLAAKRNIKTILVTSALPGEGKTTVATNLAAVMSRPDERKVLLIDADLGEPSIWKSLGIKPAYGLTALATGRAKLADAIVRLEPSGLYFLGDAGVTADQSKEASSASSLTVTSAGPDSVDLFASSRIERLLRELEQQVGMIVIDAPPIVESAGTQRLATVADGCVLVVRAGRTHHRAVDDALKLIPKDRRIGVVLNEASIEGESLIRRTSKERRSSTRSSRSKR